MKVFVIASWAGRLRLLSAIFICTAHICPTITQAHACSAISFAVTSLASPPVTSTASIATMSGMPRHSSHATIGLKNNARCCPSDQLGKGRVRAHWMWQPGCLGPPAPPALWAQAAPVGALFAAGAGRPLSPDLHHNPKCMRPSKSGGSKILDQLACASAT